MKISACRSCGARIYWLKNAATGRIAPIEVATNPGGNILAELVLGEYQIVPTAEHAAHAGTLHLNHFSTCAQRAQWKPKPGQGREVKAQ